MEKNKNRFTSINYKRLRNTALIFILAGTVGFGGCQIEKYLSNRNVNPEDDIEDIIDDEDDYEDEHEHDDENDEYDPLNEDGNLKTYPEAADEKTEKVLSDAINSGTGEVPVAIPGIDNTQVPDTNPMPDTNPTPDEVDSVERFTEWRVLDDTFEYRISLKDGHREVRHHKYRDWHYNPTTGRDERVCIQCQHVMSRDHEHAYGEWQSYDDTYERRYCKHDHAHYEQRLHAYGDWKYNQATGKDERTCSQCGHKQSKTHEDEHHIHDWLEWQSYDDTYERRYCRLDNSHYEQRLHTYGDWHYNPTTGKDQRICSQCGHVMSRIHQHNYGEWQSYDDTYERRYCSDDHSHYEQREHAYGDWRYNSSTKRDERKCSQCGHVMNRAHDHIFGQWTSLDDEYEHRTCPTDNYEEKRAHIYGDWVYNSSTGRDEATCSQCGHVKTRDHVHTHTWVDEIETYGNDPTKCYRPYHICHDNDCPQKDQKIYTGDAVGHNMVVSSYNELFGTYETTLVCSQCGYTTQVLLDYEPTIGQQVAKRRLSSNTMLALDKFINDYYINQEEKAKSKAKQYIYRS